MHHLAQLAYGWYCLGWLVYRTYRFLEEHKVYRAGISTLFSGQK